MSELRRQKSPLK